MEVYLEEIIFELGLKSWQWINQEKDRELLKKGNSGEVTHRYEAAGYQGLKQFSISAHKNECWKVARNKVGVKKTKSVSDYLRLFTSWQVLSFYLLKKKKNHRIFLSIKEAWLIWIPHKSLWEWNSRMDLQNTTLEQEIILRATEIIQARVDND